MSDDIILILLLTILNLIFIFTIWVMYVRIRQLLRDLSDLKSRMEFSDNEIEILAEAVRGIGGIK